MQPRTFLLIILLFSNPTFANTSPEVLLPLPNTEYTDTCSGITITTKTGSLLTRKTSSGTQPSMNVNISSTVEVRKSLLEPWSQMIFLASISEIKDLSFQVKIFSGNLHNIVLTPKAKFSGLVTQNFLRKDTASTIEWQVSLEILGIEKVKFKNEVLDAYKIKLIRKKINADKKVFIAEYLYSPKLQHYTHAKIQSDTNPKTVVCDIVDYKPIALAPAPAK